MIDFSHESLLTFGEAIKFLPKNSRPSNSTFWRWFRKGIKGVKLETVLVGGRRYTTAKAMQAFVEALSSPSQGSACPSLSAAQRQSIRRAERELAKAGIL